MTDLDREIEQAMWDGDVDRLHEIAGCRCCCSDHTYQEGCPAWIWGGCRGYGTLTQTDIEGWRGTTA